AWLERPGHEGGEDAWSPSGVRLWLRVRDTRPLIGTLLPLKVSEPLNGCILGMELLHKSARTVPFGSHDPIASSAGHDGEMAHPANMAWGAKAPQAEETRDLIRAGQTDPLPAAGIICR